MTSNQVNSSILSEHRKIVSTRYLLAIINFLSIFAGTLVTLFFVSRRGVHEVILKHLYVLAVINLIQIVICVAEHIMRNHKGVSLKYMPAVSYGFGVLWLLALAGELVSGTLQLGTLRTDLAVIAGIQLVVALIAYFFWPMMDRRSIDAMIRPSVRADLKKRAKKAKSFVRRYAVVCVLILLLQVGALIAYKMPPTFYDLFSDTRALGYQLNQDGDGYVVKTVYKGTATKVVIPATYNNLPVVGIATGAFADDILLEKYQITEIVFGTETTDEEGKTVIDSKLSYIEDNAIVNNNIETLLLPASINSIGTNAIASTSLRTIEYSAAAEFKFESFANCSALAKITMLGDNVGKIISLNGMDADKVVIQVDKSIYNKYRENNFDYVKSFRPILADNEFCVDFFTDCDYYIDSIFCQLGEKVVLSLDSLIKVGNTGPDLKVDTLAYIKDSHELGTPGAKDDSAFRGWYTDAYFANECKFTEGGTIEFSGNTSLYAKWIDEYEATLDWGTHMPTGEVSSVFWTNEDLSSFPVITDRVGYSRGVVWTLAGTDTQLVNSSGISKDIALKATWLLDKPSISIIPALNSDIAGETPTPNYAQFVYDENKVLSLTAQHTHPLDGTPYNGAYNKYTYEWVKKESTYSDKAQMIKLQNVAATGEYVLRVTVQSPYGETATSEVGYETRINKKPLDIGNASLPGATLIYNANNQRLNYTGSIQSENVQSTYNYYLNTAEGDRQYVSSGSGAMTVGTYTVELVFEKNNASEAANYQTATLTATMQINPLPLTFVKWSADNFIYNGAERTVTMQVSGILNADPVTILYTDNTGRNVGIKTAYATGVSNPNYTLEGIVETSHTWEIEPRVVTVKNWQVDGSDYGSHSIVYNGLSHRVYAVPDGAISGDVVTFVYSEAPEKTNAGTYRTTIVGVDNSNYTFDSSAGNAKLDWEITKRTLTVNYPHFSLLPYNGTQQAITVQIQNFCGGDEAALTLDMLDLSGNSAAAAIVSAADGTMQLSMSAVNAGTYTANVNGFVTGSSTILNNYELTAATKSFTINPRTLTVSKQSTALTYNGAVQAYKLYIDGIVSDDLALFQFAHFTTTANSGQADTQSGKFVLVYNECDAGTYPLSISDFEFDNNNYQLSAYSSNYSIAKRSISISKWQITDKAAGHTVSDLASGGSYIYNYYGYAVSALLTGVVPGETVELDLAEYEKSNKGIYTTVATLPLEYANYVLSGSSSISWSIAPYVLDLTWSLNNSTLIYDGEQRIATPSYTTLCGEAVGLVYSREERVGTNAGTYRTIVSGTDDANGNYTVGNGATYEFEITPKTVLVTWSNATNVIYSGMYQGPSFALNGLLAADVASGNLSIVATTTASSKVSGLSQPSFTFAVDAANSYSFANQTFAVDAGDYSITELRVYKSGVRDGNYKITTSATFSIAPKVITLSGAWQYSNAQSGTGLYTEGASSLIYNRQNYALTTEIASGLVERLGSMDAVSLLYINGSYKNAGEHTTTVTALSGTYAANYQLPAENLSLTWSIAPKVVRPTWTANSFVYNGEVRTQLASLTTGASSDDDGRIYSGDSYTLYYENNQKTNHGVYTASVTGIDNSNYVLDDSSANTYTWSIAQRPVRLSWAYSSTVYNGQVQYPLATVINTVNSDIVTVQRYAHASTKLVGSDYAVEALGLSNNNYTLEGGTNTSTTYEIEQRVLDYQWYATYDGTTKTNIHSLVYNKQYVTIKVELSNICGSDAVAPRYSGETSFRDAATDNTVAFTLVGADSANYALPTGADSVTFGIAKKPLSVSWKWDGSYNTMPTIIFDNRYHTLTYTLNGIEAGDTVTALEHWEKTSGSGTVDRRDAGTYQLVLVELTNSNYTFSGATSTAEQIVIRPQPVAITWESAAANIVYDGMQHERVAHVVGLNDGTEISFNYSGNNYAINANTYRIKIASLNDANYTLENYTGSIDAELVIKQRVIELVWTNAASYVYTPGTSHLMEAVLTNGVSGDDVTLQYSASFSSRTKTNAGSYTATVSGVSNSNYTVNGAEGLSTSMEITRRTVTITWAGNRVVTYDGAQHSLTATGTDEYGQTVALSHSGNNMTAAGEYTVTATLNDTTNYQLAAGTSPTATLTINKRTVGVTWAGNGTYTYHYGATHTLVPTLTNLVSGDSVNAVSSGTITAVGDVGEYTATVISLSGSMAGNYQLGAGTSATLNIVPQRVRIEWDITPVVYDGDVHVATVTVVGVDDGKAVPVTVTGSGAHVNAGEYTYVVTEVLSGNYTLSNAEGSTVGQLIIAPKPIEVVWSGLTMVEGSYDSVQAYATNILPGDVPSIDIYVPADTQLLAPGNYEVRVVGISGTNAQNYTIEGGTGITATLVIEAAPVDPNPIVPDATI